VTPPVRHRPHAVNVLVWFALPAAFWAFVLAMALR